MNWDEYWKSRDPTTVEEGEREEKLERRIKKLEESNNSLLADREQIIDLWSGRSERVEKENEWLREELRKCKDELYKEKDV